MSRKKWPLLSLLVFATAFPSAQAQEANSVVAVVNADPITRQMLSDATLKRYGQTVLDNVIINRQLIFQACKENGVTVTDAEVAEEISRLASKFGFSVQDYLKLLEESRNIAPSRYGREFIWPILALRKLVADRVEPTEEERNRAFLAEYGEAVKCRMIMVADAKKANELHQQATAKPESFGALAKQYSEDEVSASVSGLIPPIRRYTGDSDSKRVRSRSSRARSRRSSNLETNMSSCKPFAGFLKPTSRQRRSRPFVNR